MPNSSYLHIETESRSRFYGFKAKTHSKFKFGWKQDRPDSRDWKFKAPKLAKAKSLNLYTSKLPIFDQGAIGSCVFNAAATIHMFNQIKQKAPLMTPSRLFMYYNGRLIEGTVKWDAGCEIRDGIKAIARYGTCHESHWPYTIRKFTVKPSSSAYTEGMRHQAIEYRRVAQTLDELKGCLASGYPFTFGFLVYDSFLSRAVERTGTVPMPGKREHILGGHAVVAIGFSDATQRFICQNSWGQNWGSGGFFTLPYTYLTNKNLSDDFWMVGKVEQNA